MINFRWLNQCRQTKIERKIDSLPNDPRFFLTRLSAVLICVCSVIFATEPKAEEEHSFTALGGVWRAKDIVWTEIENQWLIGATIDVMQHSRRKLTGPQLLSAFCEQVVMMKPDPPGQALADADIFRVDLRVVVNGQSIWKMPVPVRVDAGECRVKAGHQIFYIRYPGALDGWRYIGSTIQKAGEDYRLQLTFEPDDGSPVKLNDFKFDQACLATLKDPTLQQLQKKLLSDNVNLPVLPHTVVIIAKQSTRQGVFIGDVYKTAGGKCIKQS